MSEVVIFGASRQGVVALQTLRAQGEFTTTGFLDDDASKQGTTVSGLPVLGGIEWVAANAERGLSAIVAIGNNATRVAVGAKLRAAGIELVNVIHPSAVVMDGVTMGTGNLICAGAVVVTGVVMEDDVVVNTGATVDHDSVLRTGAYVAPGVHTAGCVEIGRGAFVGLGASVGPGVAIGEGCIVGAGSLVLSDLPPHVLAFGVPAKVVRPLEGSVDWRKILAGEASSRRPEEAE